MPKPSTSLINMPKEQLGSAFIKDLTEKGTGHISEFCERNSVKLIEYRNGILKNLNAIFFSNLGSYYFYEDHTL
jgi:hypothetical protein